MGTELYPPNPTHDAVERKLVELSAFYDKVEDKEIYFTSDELEKFDFDTCELVNEIFGCSSILKLRRLHDINDFGEYDVKIKKRSSELLDCLRAQFVTKRVKSGPISSENVNLTKPVEKSADTVTNDDPRFKLSAETLVKPATKRSFQEDLEITRSSLTRLGYNLKKETKPNVTTEPLEKENVQVNFRPSVESVIYEAPSKENVVNIEPPKLESVAKV